MLCKPFVYLWLCADPDFHRGCPQTHRQRRKIGLGPLN